MHTPTRRRLLIGGGLGIAAAAGVGAYAWTRPAPIGYTPTEQRLAQARALLAQFPCVDAHAHPGRSFVVGAEKLSLPVWFYAKLGSFEERTIREMQEGGVAAAAFAAVADFQLLAPKDGLLQPRRAYERGEAWASYRRQIATLKGLATRGLVYPVLEPDDVATARARQRVGMLMAVEGGDFLEGRSERVSQAWDDGVRVITLLHYHDNELGDTATGSQPSKGLTAAGAAVLRRMNELGMIIDLAHASDATAKGVLAVTRRPVMASHVHVNSPTLQHPRFIGLDLARAVAQTGGGVLGAWPAGIGIQDLRGFVDHSFELIDAVGIDHVCLGTDMDANYQPVLDSYTRIPIYVAGLLERGLHEPDVAKLIGGNFLRVFAAQQPGPATATA